jgi:preprotein translocase subunit YajC
MRTVHVLTLNLVLVASAFAQDGAGPAKQGPDMVTMFMMMGGILAIMYFLMIRPEQKKQKDRQMMISALKKGNRVVTTGGIHGTVGNVKEHTVMVKVGDGVVMEFAKAAVATVLNASDEDEEK